jgi:gliding motility-associated-like protein
VTVVVLSEPPVLTVGGDAIICIGDQVTLTASADVPGTFLWQPGGETTPNITVSPTETTIYSVEFTSDCYILNETVNVEVSPGFIIDSIVITPPGEVFEGTPITLEAFTTPPILLDPFYIWLNGQDTIGAGGNLNPFNTIAPSILDDEVEAQLFTFDLLIFDAVGCDAAAAVEILVKNSEYDIPNAFTPDNDGLNDNFKVLKNDGVTIVEFKVFNRWGQLVYDNENGDQGWDGKQNGKDAPSDVYAYVILLRFGDGSEKMEKGEVTLLR